jgi:hypothetical protein
MRRLSISKAWDETKAIVGKDGQLLLSVALALIVFPQVIMAVVGLPFEPHASRLSMPVYAIVVLIGLAAQIAMNRLAIGPSVAVGTAIQRGFVRLIPLVLALVAIILALGLILLLIITVLGAAGLMAQPPAGQPPPGSLIAVMIVLVALSFAICQLFIPIAAAESGGPIAMISRSWRLARGAYLRLLAFVIMVFIGLLVLGLADRFVIGSVIILALGQPYPGTVSALVLGLIGGIIQAAFTVLSAVMLARIYVQLAGAGEVQASVPSSGI